MKKDKKIKIGFVSLGCSKNLVDTEVMLAKLVSAGYEITPEDIEADVIIVNTCAFIESAKNEAIENILDVAWLKEHRSLRAIIVTGCLAERYRTQIFDEIPEVDAVIGVGSLDHITEAVEAVLKGEKYSFFGDKNTAALGGERIVTTPGIYRLSESGGGLRQSVHLLRDSAHSRRLSQPSDRGSCEGSKGAGIDRREGAQSHRAGYDALWA